MEFKDLGRLVATKAVAELQESDKNFDTFLKICLSKYLNNDWGELCAEDRKMSDNAAVTGNERIMASYDHPTNKDWKIWIITEWDRSVTTILFPSEY